MGHSKKPFRKSDEAARVAAFRHSSCELWVNGKRVPEETRIAMLRADVASRRKARTAPIPKAKKRSKKKAKAKP